MLYLREAGPEDMMLLFDWANDPTVRMQAFHTEQIPFEDHRNWFIKILADRDTLQYILCDSTLKENQAIGQIRLAIEDKKALISYSVDKNRRGQGLGARMVLMAEEQLKQKRTDVSECIAQVKMDNVASARVFEKCGYDVDVCEKYFEFTKRIR